MHFRTGVACLQISYGFDELNTSQMRAANQKSIANCNGLTQTRKSDCPDVCYAEPLVLYGYQETYWRCQPKTSSVLWPAYVSYVFDCLAFVFEVWGLVLLFYLRRYLRKILWSGPDSSCEDCCCTVFCTCCSVAQVRYLQQERLKLPLSLYSRDVTYNTHARTK